MKKRHFKIPVICLLCTFLFAACKKDKGANKGNTGNNQNTPITPQTGVLNVGVHILDTSALVSATTGSIEINPAGLLYTPKPGDIIIASPSAKNPPGLMVRLVSMFDKGSDIIFTFDPVSLTDAFKQLSFSYIYTGSYSATYTPSALRTNIITQRAAKPGLTTINIDFNKPGYPSPNIQYTGKLQLTFTNTTINYVENNNNSALDSLTVSTNFTSQWESDLVVKTTGTANTSPVSVNVPVQLPAFFVPVTVGSQTITISFAQSVGVQIMPAAISDSLYMSIQPIVLANLQLNMIGGKWQNNSTSDLSHSSMYPLPTIGNAGKVNANITVATPTYTLSPFGQPSSALSFAMSNSINTTVNKTANPNYTVNQGLIMSANVNSAFWIGGNNTDYSLALPVNQMVLSQRNFGYKLGQKLFGGIIFYLDPTQLHGMVIDTVDLASNYSLAVPQNRNISPMPADSSDGAALTAWIIQNNSTDAQIAEVCTSYRGGGYTDWYLPTDYQLLLVSQFKLGSGIYFTCEPVLANPSKYGYPSPYYYPLLVALPSGLPQYPGPGTTKTVKVIANVRAVRNF